MVRIGCMTLKCLMLFFIVVWPGRVLSDIYKYVDDNGVTHFTNIPSHRGFSVILRNSNKAKTRYREKKYDGLITKLCRKYAVDTALVKAVIKAESDFDPYAVSRKGAQGLMQLMPATIKELNIDNPFDPHQNLRGGISYLSMLLEKFKRDETLALAAYNAGENVVCRYNSVPPYPETREYVKKVLTYKTRFQ